MCDFLATRSNFAVRPTTEITMIDESFTPKETCEKLKMGQTKFWGLVKAGKLKTFTIGRARRVTGSEISRVMQEGV